MIINEETLLEKIEELKLLELSNRMEHDWVFCSIGNKLWNNEDEILKELDLGQYQFTRRFRKWWWSR